MPPGRVAAFASNDELLEAALEVFRARRQLFSARNEEEVEEDTLRCLRRREAAWTRCWHDSFRLTEKSVAICERCTQHRLSRTEREIVVLLLLDRLALLEDGVQTCGDVINALGLPTRKVVDALRRLSEHGRLYKVGLISYEDPDEDMRDRKLIVDPALVDTVLFEKEGNSIGWPVKIEAELHGHLCGLTRVLQKKSDGLDNAICGFGNESDVYKLNRKTDRLLNSLKETLELHPKWKLSALRQQGFLKPDWVMLLALIGKELGHLSADEPLFQGAGLARAASRSIAEFQFNIKRLMSNRKLVRDGLVQACGGSDNLLTDDPQSLKETEFELTVKTAESLGLRRCIVKTRSSEFYVREPKVRMDQLILSDTVRRSLNMAIAHARDAATLADEWGLGEIIPYGRSVAMLFSGPPGTGKTASAEAVAYQLRRPILVADYARIQNCLIGNTEKNIVKAFREAKSSDAVLFWDEADAMFFDRDSAGHNWEVRDVNVLLQELERFDGVCILATNRKTMLDKALERRISLKVEFDRPNKRMRSDIWRRLLPSKMPVARDVDIEELSHAELSGGEMKNVVLNAARIALERDGSRSVTMKDFREAIAMETGGRWNGQSRSPIGFAAQRT